MRLKHCYGSLWASAEVAYTAVVYVSQARLRGARGTRQHGTREGRAKAWGASLTNEKEMSRKGRKESGAKARRGEQNVPYLFILDRAVAA